MDAGPRPFGGNPRSMLRPYRAMSRARLRSYKFQMRRIVMPKMKAAQVTRPGGPIELVEREVPQPGPGDVRVRVQACGICHSDAFTKEGHWPGIQYPRVPGHEIAGVVDEVGAGVIGWAKGQRVGVGWYGGHCGHCRACRRGEFVNCEYLPVSRDYLRRRLRGVHGGARGCFGTHAGRYFRGGSRSVALCGHHHFQCAPKQWRAARRPRGDTRGWRVGPFGQSSSPRSLDIGWRP